jgi:hypothetical protein
MTDRDHDLTLHRLRQLAVLQPAAARSQDVRTRCRAALDARRGALPARPTRGGLSAPPLASGLGWALSAGYASAVLHDVLRVYLLR